MSEGQIIRRILSGEEQLFARIVERYSGYVWALCSSYVRNPSDCEDVAQEVFVQCYRRLDTLRNPAAFGCWLGQLARRQCLTWLRSSARREERLAKYENGLEPAYAQRSAMEKPIREELRRGIRDEIDMLPPDYREALLLRYTEGYSAEEAASFLGISPAAMRKRLERAQAMLKDRLWDHVEPTLAKDKHKDTFAPAVLAAIPFGEASWLGAGTAGTAAALTGTSKLALIGGVAVMSKKIVVGVGVVVLLAGLGFFATHRPASVSKKNAGTTTSSSVSATTETRHASKPDTVEQASSPEASAVAKAETASAAAPGETERLASVSGKVEDQAEQPVAGADVYIEIGRDKYCNDVIKTFATKTGSDGRYEISDIDVFGSAWAFASAEGYVMARKRFKVFGGSKLKGIDLTLSPAAFYVEGHVVNAGRAPISEAFVDTMYYGYDEEGLAHTAETGQTTGTISSAKFAFALTDTHGFFRIAIPNEGLCDFRVRKDGYGTGFFPKVATGTRDAIFVLRSGGAISGKVTNADGSPAAGTTVEVKGEALPGGLAPSKVRIQALNGTPVAVTTGADGSYLAEGLGEDYVYTVTIPGSDTSEDGIEAMDIRRVHIVAAMRDLEEDVFSGQSVAAQKTGIYVKAGQTTKDVDFVLGAETDAVIWGKVTDRTSGAPVCPVVVTAGLVDDDADPTAKQPIWFQTSSGGSGVTKPDGSYVLRIWNLTEAARYHITYVFMTEGGSAWEQPDEQIALLELKAGDKRELNFTVDAPLTVPVRYVDTSGAPQEGIMAAMRRAGGRGGCGGTLISDSEGRVTFHGIRPSVELQAVAWREVGGDLQTVGVSEPFIGQPGETVPEVTVVCRLMGGVEATIAYADGRPVAETEVTCEARLADNASNPVSGQLTTDSAGMIRIPDMVPEGIYAAMSVAFLDRASGQLLSGSVENVEVRAGEVTNAGRVVVQASNDWQKMLETADYGRKSNETIAQAYSPDWLDAFTEPSMFLKTGFALYDAGKYQEALDVFARMSQTTEDNALYSAIAQVWQGQMLDLLGRRDEAVAAYTNAANMDVARKIRHDQFGMAYSPSEYARERMETPFTRLENNMP